MLLLPAVTLLSGPHSEQAVRIWSLACTYPRLPLIRSFLFYGIQDDALGRRRAGPSIPPHDSRHEPLHTVNARKVMVP